MIRFGHVHRDRSESRLAAGGFAAGELSGKEWLAQKRTLANLSKLPEDVVALLKAVLKGGTLISTKELEIERSLPHGHVAAALGVVRKIGLDRLILSRRRMRDHGAMAIWWWRCWSTG